MWWILIPIVFALILYKSTRNLTEYCCKSKGYIPVKFPIWKILLLLILLFIPITNIFIFLLCIIWIFIGVSVGTKNTYEGLKVLKGKKNWIYSVVKFLQKEI